MLVSSSGNDTCLGLGRLRVVLSSNGINYRQFMYTITLLVRTIYPSDLSHQTVLMPRLYSVPPTCMAALSPPHLPTTPT